MPSDVKSLGVGIIGTGPLSQFVLERLSLRRDFALVAQVSSTDASSRSLIQDAGTDIAYFAEPVQCDLVASALAARKAVVLSMNHGLGERDLRSLAEVARSASTIAVIDQPRRWDADFVCAQSVFKAGHLGQLQRIRLSIHECSIPGEAFPNGVLHDLGCHFLDQLLVFVAAEPQSVRYRRFANTATPHEDGILIVIDFEDGTSAVVELQTQSLLSLRTGWLLEGVAGAYRAGRRYSKTADGEIIDEPVSPTVVSSDLFLDTLKRAMDGDCAAIENLPGLSHAARVAKLLWYIQASDLRQSLESSP